jgi:hypothetical protein
MTKQNALVPASGAQQISTAGQPAGGRTKRKRGKTARILARSAVAASVAAVGLAAMALGGTNAYADTLVNGPNAQVGNYAVPSTPPGYADDGDLLPLYDGTLGNPAAIVLSGSTADGTANTDVIQIPNNSTNSGTQLATGAGTQTSGQTWYFQRVGYIGMNTPETSPSPYQLTTSPPEVLAAPVYRIVNYNPAGGFTCLEGWGDTPVAGSIVDSHACTGNQINQMWIVGSPAQSNHLHSSDTGAYLGTSAPQLYSPYLQGSGSGTSGLQGSVIENVGSFAAGGLYTATAPVLSADASNAQGINSDLTLQSQTSPASTANSTWNIVPTSAAPGSSN